MNENQFAHLSTYLYLSVLMSIYLCIYLSSTYHLCHRSSLSMCPLSSLSVWSQIVSQCDCIFLQYNFLSLRTLFPIFEWGGSNFPSSPLSTGSVGVEWGINRQGTWSNGTCWIYFFLGKDTDGVSSERHSLQIGPLITNMPKTRIIFLFSTLLLIMFTPCLSSLHSCLHE